MTNEEKVDKIVKDLLDQGTTSAVRVGEHVSEILAYDVTPEDIVICAVDLEEMAEFARMTASKLRQIVLEEAVR